MRKFAYFGTPAVAAQTLAALLAHGYAPSVVITNPDAPRGRGMKLAPSPVKALALEKGLPVLAPEQLDAVALEEIKKHACDYAVVVAYGKLFPQALIESFPMGAINVHYSLLPRYRGASPVEAALLAGERETGVTVQKLALAMDAGDILAAREIPIAPEETARELFPKLIALGADLLVETLPKFEAGELAAAAQDESQATYSKKIKKEEGELDLAGDALANWNKYRAYLLRPGTYFIENGKRMKIAKASFANGRFVVERIVPENGREIDYRSA
ncbi:MAG TPA: methionyl-tRNA formyltransferase [Candidatus Paceibacterota bacterium]|nr:methionyl-tRNA formyltransferase [Candidatus Paceibacterota bacterium]